MKYDLKLFLIRIITGAVTTILTSFTIMENASAFVNETEMKKFQEINRKNHDAEIEAILNGNFPGQGEIFEEYPPIVGNIAFFDEEKNYYDLIPEKKKQLKKIKNNYPLTQKRIAEFEGWISCKMDELGFIKRKAIGYGDNMFLLKNPEVKCISKDMGKYLKIKHIESLVPQINKDIFKNQPEAYCPEFRAILTGKVYQYGGDGIKDRTRGMYFLIQEGVYKNWDKIKGIWLTLQHKERAEREIAYVENDPCFKKALAKYKAKHQPKKQQKRKQSMSQILEEIGA